jgi:hypothetical protein
VSFGLSIASVVLVAAVPTTNEVGRRAEVGGATYEVGLRTEVRGATGATESSGDLQLNPALLLTVPIRPLTFTASYSPRILELVPRSRGGFTVLHRGAFLGAWRTRSGGRFFVDQQASYGTNAFSLLVAAAEGSTLTLDRLTELPPLLYFSETTLLGIEQPLSRKLHLTASATYGVSGGADDVAKNQLPLQRAPKAALTLAWLIQRRDTVSAAVHYSGSYFSAGARAHVFDVSASWRHRFNRDELELGLGAARSRDVGADRSVRLYTQPLATVRLRREPTKRRFHRFGGNLRVRLAPAIDPLGGAGSTSLTYLRVDGLGEIDYLPIPKLKLTAGGGAALALSGSLSGQSVGLAGLSASYEVDRHFSLTGGVRFVSQPRGAQTEAPPPTPASVPQTTTQWVGFVAVSLSYREPL